MYERPTARAGKQAAGEEKSPTRIVPKRMLNELRDKGDAFHQTGEGAAPTVADVTTATNPNTLTLTWRHPLG